MYNFVWKIESATSESDGFVTDLEYSVTASKDGKSEKTTNQLKFVKNIDKDGNAQAFIPFAQLTEAVCLSWVYNHIVKSALEQSVVAILENKREPAILPWAVVPAEPANEP